MQYKLVLLDVDGTLLPKGSRTPAKSVIKAAKALQEAGIKVAIATGRGLPALSKEVLGGLKPDYLICCNGAWLLDGRRNTVYTANMTEQEMYCLVDWCEDYDYPLAFVFPDGYYAYVEYEAINAFYNTIGGFTNLVKDGEDQDQHLQGMPLAAFCSMPRSGVEGFCKKYGHLGLRFMAYSEDKFDIGTERADKAVGLAHLMELLQLSREEVAAVGDGPNDARMMELAGLGACMDNGAPEAKQAAGQLVPSDTPEGLAAFLRGLL